MNRRDYNNALKAYKELRKEIDNLLGVGIHNNMKIEICSKESSNTNFNLRELNKHLFK